MFAILITIDLYAYQAFKTLIKKLSPKKQRIIKGLYWFVSFALYLYIILLIAGFSKSMSRTFLTLSGGLLSGIFLSKLFVVVFLLFEDIYRLFKKLYALNFTKKEKEKLPQKKGLVSRKKFISQIGAGMGLLAFSGIAYGILKGAHNYKLHHVKIKAGNGLKGLKIGQLSDIHMGSFWDKNAIQKGVDLLMNQKPDIVFFTGDLVNDLETEVSEEMISIFSQVKAPLGVYSILGNHDYGDYHQWPDRDNMKAMSGKFENKAHMSPMQLENLELLKLKHKTLGWQLLLNENKQVAFNGAMFNVIGVENYGVRGRFPKYGDLNKAMENIVANHYNILLSHDPSHWDAQVVGNIAINLMLAGHTHGSQFGIETAKFRWSPVEYMYNQWAGLYEKQGQFIYVNRGFGYLGYPGRLGINPEVTILEMA